MMTSNLNCQSQLPFSLTLLLPSYATLDKSFRQSANISEMPTMCQAIPDGGDIIEDGWINVVSALTELNLALLTSAPLTGKLGLLTQRF